MNENKSTFDGTVLGYIGHSILFFIITVFTLGLAFPWAICMFQKWETHHTIIDGRRLTFEGTGLSLFGHYIKWWLFTIITFGIYGFWLHNAIKRWVVERTHFESQI